MHMFQILKHQGIRITFRDAWLVLNAEGEYVVYQRKYGQKKSRQLYQGTNEEDALEILLNS